VPDVYKSWEPEPPGALGAYLGMYRYSFNLFNTRIPGRIICVVMGAKELGFNSWQGKESVCFKPTKLIGAKSFLFNYVVVGLAVGD
jgi:hypothetical protein